MKEELIAIWHFVFAFVITSFAIKYWINVAKENNLTGIDVHKTKKTQVAEAGGIAVILSFCIIILMYIFFKTFYLDTARNILEILVILVTVLLAGFIGFIDDILGWKRGLRQYQKFLLTLLIVIPLVVINVSNGSLNLPFFGTIDFGLWFPLFLIPLGIIATTNAYNLLAGYNGLEAGLGIILFSSMGLIMFLQESMWLALICFVLVCCLIAFLRFNFDPAKIFPGDSLTYPVGALIAVVAILGNFEKIVLIMFIPYIFEVGLKLRGKLQKESFAKPNKDDSLELRYKKFYGLEHISLAFLKKFKKKVYEKEVVYMLYFIQLIFCILGILYYLNL